jgi:hypothetical protein
MDIEGILFVSVPETYNESKQTVDEVMEKFGNAVRIYDYVVPRLTEVTKAIRQQTPMLVYEDKAARIKQGESIVAGLYQRLAKEVMNNE